MCVDMCCGQIENSSMAAFSRPPLPPSNVLEIKSCVDVGVQRKTSAGPILCDGIHMEKWGGSEEVPKIPDCSYRAMLLE